MNWTHVLRVAWKDYRRMNAFWLALVGFWVVCLGVTVWLSFDARNFVAPLTVEQTLLAVLATAMIHALGWGSITFAAEHEDKTYGFLRSLPVNAKSVFYGKLFYGIHSTLFMIAALGVLCLVHSMILQSQGGRYEWSGESDALAGWEMAAGGTGMTVMIPLAMVLGIFWSLRTQRALHALVAAGVSVFLLPYAVAFGVAGFANDGFGDPGNIDLWSCVVLGIGVVILFVVDRRLAAEWLPNYQGAGVLPAHSVGANPSRVPSLSRLLWLSRKQHWRLTLVLGAIGIAAAALPLPNGTTSAGVFSTLAAFLVGVLGIIAFRAEHVDKRFRLLAQLGVSAQQYWFSRLAVPLVIAMVIATVKFVTQGTEAFAFGHGLLTAFAIGQLCSLAFSSTVVAIAATLIVGLVVWFWLYLCHINGIPFWLAYPPPIVLPLLASYWRVPRWFRETGSWRQWIVPASPMLVLFVGVPLATALYRIHEVPHAEFAVDFPVEPESPAEGADEYRAVFSQLPLRQNQLGEISHDPTQLMKSPLLQIWAEENEEWIVRLADATEVDRAFPEEFQGDATFNGVRADPSIVGGALLLISAARFEQQADLESAWQRYVAALNLARHRNDGRSGSYGVIMAMSIEQAVYERLVDWAMHTKNTAEQVEQSAVFLDDYRQRQPPWTDSLAGDYRFWRRVVEDARTDVVSLSAADRLRWEFLLFTPWEKTRARRLLDLRFARDTRAYVEVQSRSRPARDLWHEHRAADHPVQRLAATTFMGESLAAADNINLAQTFEHGENVRRGTIYQLAAIAYHRKHGQYPTSFDDVRLASRELPDDFYSAGHKMEIGRDPDGFAMPLSGSYVLGHGPAARNQITYSDGDYDQRHFLLPEFENWSKSQFSYRASQSKQDLRRNLRPSPPDSSFDGYGMSGYGMLSEEDRARMEYESRLATLQDVLHEANRFQNGIALDVIRESIRTIILEGDVPTRLHTLRRMSSAAASEFAPELTQLLGDDNVVIRAQAAATIKTMFEEADEQQLAEFHAVLSTREGLGDAPSLYGVPIVNTANGHFYEIFELAELFRFEDQAGWLDAKRAAERRLYKGTRGHLVTITSKQESDFLAEAFVVLHSNEHYVTAWAGASDADEEGRWKWVCGPETETEFWNATDRQLQFTNWGESEPRNALGNEDFLLWRAWMSNDSRQEDRAFSSHWMAVDQWGVSTANLQNPRIYLIVEYSSGAESAPETDDDDKDPIDSRP